MQKKNFMTNLKATLQFKASLKKASVLKYISRYSTVPLHDVDTIQKFCLKFQNYTKKRT